MWKGWPSEIMHLILIITYSSIYIYTSYLLGGCTWFWPSRFVVNMRVFEVSQLLNQNFPSEVIQKKSSLHLFPNYRWSTNYSEQLFCVPFVTVGGSPKDLHSESESISSIFFLCFLIFSLCLLIWSSRSRMESLCSSISSSWWCALSSLSLLSCWASYNGNSEWINDECILCTTICPHWWSFPN